MDCASKSIWATTIFSPACRRACHPSARLSPEIPATQRVAPTAPRQPKSFQDCLAECGTRNQALAMAYREGGMTMPALAIATGLSVSRVSRLMVAFERVEATGKT